MKSYAIISGRQPMDQLLLTHLDSWHGCPIPGGSAWIVSFRPKKGMEEQARAQVASAGATVFPHIVESASGVGTSVAASLVAQSVLATDNTFTAARKCFESIQFPPLYPSE